MSKSKENTLEKARKMGIDPRQAFEANRLLSTDPVQEYLLLKARIFESAEENATQDELARFKLMENALLLAIARKLELPDDKRPQFPN